MSFKDYNDAVDRERTRDISENTWQCWYVNNEWVEFEDMTKERAIAPDIFATEEDVISF